MNMFARFDENPAMTLRVIKETKRYGRTDARTDTQTDNVKTVYPLQTKFAGGIISKQQICLLFTSAELVKSVSRSALYFSDFSSGQKCWKYMKLYHQNKCFQRKSL